MLKGRTWNGEPAPGYLFDRLTGEDGEAPWSGEEAAKKVSAKLKVRITPQTISKWLKSEHANRRAMENYEVVQRTTLEFLSENGEKALDLDRIVNVQMVLMIGRIHSEDGAEEAIKAMSAFTKLKQAMTAERQLSQRTKEYEESVEKLKLRIDALCKALKKSGGSSEKIDEMNLAAVAAVDELIRKG